MKIEAGKYYLTASGQIVEIDYESNKIYYAKDSGIEYCYDGKFWNDDSDS